MRTTKTAAERITTISTWNRSDILKVCRAVGISAHRIKDRRKLAEMLVHAIDAAWAATSAEQPTKFQQEKHAF